MKPWTVRIVPVLVALAVLAGPAPAQDSRVADARREGKVVWTYPGVKVEVHRSGSERVLQRIMQELQAGIKNADVVYGFLYTERRKGSPVAAGYPRDGRFVELFGA
jgi:hypothetical protein